MRKRGDSLGDEIRENRKAAGETQESLAFKLRVNRTTVGEWERNEVFPSPANIRGLMNLDLVDGSASRHEKGRQPLSPALTGRIMEAFGCHLSELHLRIVHFHDDHERAMVGFFRILPVEQKVAFLEIISSMGAMVARCE